MGYVLVIKVKESRSSKTVEYKNEINLLDPNLILQVFQDLEGFGMPLEKVVRKYINNDKTFPI